MSEFIFLVMCPFGIPLLVGLYMVFAYPQTRFKWLAILFTWKPLIATWLVLFAGLSMYSTLDSGLPVSIAVGAISPAVFITVLLVLVFQDVFRSPAQYAARILLALDTIRWGNTFLLFVIGGMESGVNVLLLSAFAGLVFPTVFAVVAVRLVEQQQFSRYAGSKKKKKRGK